MNVNREAVFGYVKENYGTEPEFLWANTPDAAVLRNRRNKKWYALVMSVPKNKIGLDGEGCIDVLNVKCSSLVREILIGEGKAIPAYHMNKRLWISIPLNERITPTELYAVIDESYDIIQK